MKLLNIVHESLLTEGRKEDVYKKYWPEYQKLGGEYGDLESQYRGLVESFSEADPSGNNKYLDWMVKSQLEILRGNYQIHRDENPDDFIVNLVNSFHKNIAKISSEFAKQKGFPKRVVGAPKDINVYNLRDMKIMSGILERIQKSKQTLSDAYVLFENDRWLIISPKTYEASCKYGAGTKWCVASKKTTSHYQSYTNQGKLVFVIDKKDKDFTPGLPYNENPMYKIAVYYKNGSTTIWNAPDKQIGTDLSYFFAPNIQKIITDFFCSSQADISWKDNKDEIEEWFSSNPRVFDWDGFLGGEYCFLDYHGVDLGYYLRVLPYGLNWHQDTNPRSYLVIELWKTQTSESGERQIESWEEYLDLKTTTPIEDMEEGLQRILAGPIDATIIDDAIYLELRKEIYNGWRFDVTGRGSETFTFQGINDKLSSYYWDKYDIKLEFNWMDNQVKLSCVFKPDNKKPISKTFTHAHPTFNLKTLGLDISQIKLEIQNDLRNFFEQTKNK